jgi:twitching motility protein PilT
LLAQLDEPGVSEVVLGIGRPVAVRGADGFRPVTSMNFARNDIEILVAGTPMSGLIGSPTSLPPVEVHVESRRLVVEVVRQGYNAALRIALVGSQAASADTRSSSTIASPTPPSATPSRTVAGTAPPAPVTTDDAPLVSVRMTSSTKPPGAASGTTPPRTVATTASPQQPIPNDDAPIVSVRMTSPTTPPGETTPAPPRTMTTTAPPPRAIAPTPTPSPAAPLAVAPLATAKMPRLAPEPIPQPEPIHHVIDAQREAVAAAVSPAVVNLDLGYASVLGGGGEIEEANHEESVMPDGAGDGYAPEWYGPQIIDEHTDITALHALLEAAYRRTASDLHIIARQPIVIRRLGDLTPLGVDALSQPCDRMVYSALVGALDPTLAERFLLPLLGPAARQRLAEAGYVDLGFQVPGRGRVRANISQQQDGLAGTFRLCRDTTPTLESLGLPRELQNTVRHHQGLVVIAGPSGHGKTTTMAALVDLLNASNSHHIITIEDPVEIEHQAKRAIVSHREVGRHTLSFVSALKASLREDPDVIVIGELRDRETVEIALAAAETGHLVLSTVSTPSAVKTIDRLIDMFPPDDQVQVRASISGTLRAVIAQRLLPNVARDGLVAAIELVTGVLPLATLIRDNKLFQLPSLMQRGRAFGMIRLDDSLAEHVRAKRITEEVALAAAENKRDLIAVMSSRQAATTTNVKGLFGGKRPT